MNDLMSETQDSCEESAVVVAELWAEMKTRVTDYGAGAFEVDACIHGTAFFPGGAGLWRAFRDWRVIADAVRRAKPA